MRKYPPDTILGAGLGFLFGTLLGALGLLNDALIWLTVALGLGVLLLNISFHHGPGDSFKTAVYAGVVGIVGSMLAVCTFFGVVFGAFFLVDCLFSLPPWSSYWARYPVSREYLLKGCGTVLVLWVLGWLFRDRISTTANNVIEHIAVALLIGLCGFAVTGIALVPLLVVIIPLDLLHVSLPSGLMGGISGSILGMFFGIVLGAVAPLFGEILRGI